MRYNFIVRALHQMVSAVDNRAKDMALLIRTLRRMGATLVSDQEFANKRVLVFNAPKVNTGEFSLRFFRIAEIAGVSRAVPSKPVLDSFRSMGYKPGINLSKGQVSFTKDGFRVQVGSPKSGSSGSMQGLVVSFERLL